MKTRRCDLRFLRSTFNNKLRFYAMKKLLLLLTVLLPMFCIAQAHLGSTENEIRNKYPNKTFEVGYSDDGEKYIKTFMVYGNFIYYFNKENGLSNFCMQIIDEMPYLNGQVEAYNKKYVIISDTEWKAYLEDGGILNIKLSYNEEYKVHVFSYTD